MNKVIFYIGALAALTSGCKKKQEEKPEKQVAPVITSGGETITFPDAATSGFFSVDTVGNKQLEGQLEAPAKVAAIVSTSREGAGHNLIIFDDPELTANFTQLLTHRQEVVQLQGVLRQKKALVEKKKVEVARFEDLFKNGAGTGKDVADAQMDLLGAETEVSMTVNQLEAASTAIVEHESKLKTAGFDPAALRMSKPGKAIIIGEVTENQLSNIVDGSACQLRFSAFPGRIFEGRVEDIGDLIDRTSQMIKIRISLANEGDKLKAGMFAGLSLGVREGDKLSIPKSSVVTIQGKSYVFVKEDTARFARKEIVTGHEMGDRFIVVSGLLPGQMVVNKGVMQLKGLSFGY